MRNFKMVLQYEGSRYQGWQKQESTGNTIQGKLETLLSKLAGTTIEVHGSGRTDAGVHAYGQVANFKMETDKTPEELFDYINQYLPEDIAVIKLEEVPERFHSRLNAKRKIYRYRVMNSGLPHVFARRYTYQVPEKLDMDAMKAAADKMCGEHDFQAFTSAKKGKKSTVRRVDSIKIERVGDEIWFTFFGNGFLYHMVRIMMGTLLCVGKGELEVDNIPLILDSKDRQQAGPLVPAKGLALMEVFYE